MYHIKHQKTLRAINRANHKQAQSLAKRAKRLDCKLTLSVVFVSKNSIVIQWVQLCYLKRKTTSKSFSEW